MNRRIYFIIIGVALFSISTAYLLANDASTTESSVKFKFELNGTRKTQLVEGLALIKVGDSIEQVKKILGNPTAEEELVGKKGEFISKVLEYYIKRVETNGTNIHDQLISLYFDRSGQLIKIEKSYK